tara:strand:+ start:200 stop:328 length:129 start_codon:yes stop_codon:yes gene_type:complete
MKEVFKGQETTVQSVEKQRIGEPVKDQDEKRRKKGKKNWKRG